MQIRQGPVSVSERLLGSFVLILISVDEMMSISPVSTAIFPKSETAMLSRSEAHALQGWREERKDEV